MYPLDAETILEIQRQRDLKVYLLYALYPCSGWSRDRHGPTRECDCDSFLEGVFSSTVKAKAYIPKALNEAHIDLTWEKEEPIEGCFHDEYAQAADELFYLIREYTVS